MIDDVLHPAINVASVKLLEAAIKGLTDQSTQHATLYLKVLDLRLYKIKSNCSSCLGPFK